MMFGKTILLALILLSTFIQGRGSHLRSENDMLSFKERELAPGGKKNKNTEPEYCNGVRLWTMEEVRFNAKRS